MKVVQVHNRYRIWGGEDTVVDSILSGMIDHGVEVIGFIQESYSSASRSRLQLIESLGGLYSRAAYRKMKHLIWQEKPDVVHVHNLFPLISPSILLACRKEGIPVVMSCHNYRLVCPIGSLFSHGEICERCNGGHEYVCLLKNCTGNIIQSGVYAFRNWAARILRLYKDNVTIYVVPSDFVRRKLIEFGFNDNKFILVPHGVQSPSIESNSTEGHYIAYVGRISPEKGIHVLLRAAKLCPEIPIRIAGNHSGQTGILQSAPSNVKFLGHLSPNELEDFYKAARFVVFPSVHYEIYGLGAPEAMGHSLPVIASRIGGVQEIVDDNVTGMLFEPGNTQDLAKKMKFLWNSPKACMKMGRAGRKKAKTEYDLQKFFQQLKVAFARGIEICN